MNVSKIMRIFSWGLVDFEEFFFSPRQEMWTQTTIIIDGGNGILRRCSAGYAIIPCAQDQICVFFPIRIIFRESHFVLGFTPPYYIHYNHIKSKSYIIQFLKKLIINIKSKLDLTKGNQF